MKFDFEIEAFINHYVKALRERNAVIFAGAGMSVSEGFFNWMELLKPIADRLGLDIYEEQNDLSSLAQYFVDNRGGVRGELDQIMTEEYGKMKMTISENHRILSRLPIEIYWTTNYDRLIETALIEQGKTPDVKKSQTDLTVNLPKRDAIVYKMHGDIGTVSETVLTKHEYEDYNKTRELFSNAFRSDYVSRTFLFIGFSFNDPNLDYLISRIRTTLGKNIKPDYFFIKRDENVKVQRRQELRADSLKRYGLNPLWIDDYTEITNILEEVEIRFLRNNIFISGSAENYGDFGHDRAIEFLYELGLVISENSNKILTGFGHGVGSAVINGVLNNMEHERNQDIDNYLIMRPFPQFSNKEIEIKELWTNYRKKFISLAGIEVIVFGNRKNKETGEIERSIGMYEEFEISLDKGLKIVPVGATGFVARDIWERVINEFEKYYPDHINLKKDFLILGDIKNSNATILKSIISIINTLNSK